MTTEEIIEGNRLIAEFMNISYNNKNMKLVWKNGLLIDELAISYHSSWDWLMPAVLKCNTINATQLYHELSISMFATDNIERVWLAIVKFIKWYNNSKLPKDGK